MENKKLTLYKGTETYTLFIDGELFGCIEGGNYLKLSQKNCDEIFGVINLEDLIDIRTEGIIENHIKALAKTYFKYGFNEANSLNKEKEFSINDLKKVYLIGKISKDTHKAGIQTDAFNKALRQIKQQKEIEVEMEYSEDSCDDFKSKPKLDDNNCVILKRK